MKYYSKPILHVAVWVAILLLFILISSSGHSFYRSIIMVGYFGIINIAIFYVNYLIILPRYLITQKYWVFAASIVTLVLLSGLLKYGIAHHYHDFLLNRGSLAGKGAKEITFLQYYTGTIFTSIFFVFLSTGFKFTVDYFSNDKLRKGLEKEKLTAELAFLKSQINPHFLMNSLNNIYSLTYQKSDKAPEAILKLSEIMRYMLYESNDARVALNKEISYLESYIELQKLRFKDGASININVNCDGSIQTIVPLILIPFVENAFKHGVATDPAKPITIQIDVADNKLVFKIENQISHQNKDESGGIGMHNVKRRLDLLYPAKYSLLINNSHDVYCCQLYLDL